MDIEQIRQLVNQGSWEFSLHALKQMDAREIRASSVLEALCTGEVLEDYPNDSRGASCLVLGYPASGALHVVCGTRDNGSKLVIITVYRPEPPRWIDERTRGRDAR